MCSLLIAGRPAVLITLRVLSPCLKMSSESVFGLVTEIQMQGKTCIIHLDLIACAWQPDIDFNTGGGKNSLSP